MHFLGDRLVDIHHPQSALKFGILHAELDRVSGGTMTCEVLLASLYDATCVSALVLVFVMFHSFIWLYVASVRRRLQ